MPLWSILALTLAAAEPELSPEYLEAFQLAEAENSWVYDNYRTDTEEALERLAAALSRIEVFEDELSRDEYGRRLVINLRKSLARTLLARGKKGDAVEAQRIVADLVVVSAMESTDLFFGEQLEAMFTAQQAAMAAKGKGTVEVVCHQACVALVDRRPLDGTEQQLYLGSYVVEVRAASGTEPSPVREKLELTAKDQRRIVVFGNPPESEPAPEPTLEPKPRPEAAPVPVVMPASMPAPVLEAPKRLLPRWLELSSLVAGVGLAAAGGGMLSVDGKCQTLTADTETCPQLWESTPASAAMLAIGGGMAVASAILLGIDERRARRAKERRVVLLPAAVMVRF